MSEIKDGGPAFPTKHPALDPRASGFFTEDGMTLRDYAAIKFAAALLANPAHHNEVHQHDVRQALAFKEADAMLRAREVNHD